MSRITDMVSSLAEPVVVKEGCSLWDVEFVKEAGTWYLRIYIDKEQGVSIDDCERISRILDPLLDDADPITESYVFEVCSAGADRVLKRESDYIRYCGTAVDIKLYKPMNGLKSFTGVLQSYDDGNITVSVNGESVFFEKDSIAQTRLHVEF